MGVRVEDELELAKKTGIGKVLRQRECLGEGGR
jgi:hypothetical protein